MTMLPPIHVRSWRLLLLLGLLLAGAVRSGQFTTILPENAAQLAPVTMLGRGDIRSLAWSPDAIRLAVATSRGVWLHDSSPSGVDPGPYGGQTGAGSIAFHPTDLSFASGGDDGSVVVWSDSGEPMLRLLAHLYRVSALAYSPDGRLLASADLSGIVRLWDTATGAEQRVHESRGAQNTLAFSPDGTRLAAAGDETTRLWNAETGALLLELPPAEQLAFSTDGLRLATLGGAATAEDARRFLRVWDTATGERLDSWPAHPFTLALEFDADGLLWAYSAQRGAIWRSSPATGDSTVVFPAVHDPQLLTVAGARAAQVDRRGLLWIGDAGGGAEWRDYMQPLYALAWADDERVIAMPRFAGGALLWNVGDSATAPFQWHDRDPRLNSTANLAYTLVYGGRNADAEIVTVAAHSPDGRWRATAANGGAEVRDWVDGPGEFRFWLDTRAPTRALAYSPDGTLLATGGDDAVIRLWDAETGAELAQLRGHGRSVTALAFSPDGALLASGSLDGTAAVWDVSTTTRLAVLQAHTAGVTGVAFNPSGALLASSSYDGTIVVWGHAG